MLRTHRLIAPLVLGLVLAACGAGTHVTTASASTSLESIIQDDGQLKANPAGTLDTFKLLGADRVRLSLTWDQIAPNPLGKKAPKHFNASDPASYPARNWAVFDTIDRLAKDRGIQLDLTLTGPAPRWATGGGQPPKGPHLQWKPSGRQFRSFVEAAGKRYSGSYTPSGQTTPLPRISFWAIWNEPNFGPDLAPQALNGRGSIESSPTLYRNLADSAWLGLHRTGHGNDTIIFGELAPRGYGSPPVFPGNFAGMRPLVFLRALYCVDKSYHRLRGSDATVRGCPANGSATAFRSQHPVLFHASAFAQHPYPQGAAPNVPTGDPEFADLPQIHKLMRVLDTLQHVWGSGKRFGIYNTEYGYQTRPPDKRFRQPSPTTAAYYENWAEYIHYKDPRIKSYMHYLLRDAPGGFPSGLEFRNGSHKATFDAWRMPLYLPHTKGKKGSSLEVWGCVRPEDYNVGLGGATTVAVQFNGTTIANVPLNNNGYFDVRIKFPSSGQVRLSWAYPGGATIFSRTENVKLS